MDHKNSTESGYESQTSSRVDIHMHTSSESSRSTSIFPIEELLEEPRIISDSESAAGLYYKNNFHPLTFVHPGVQDTRRGSAESNPSCSSFASTPVSTRPLLDQSRRNSLTLNLRDDFCGLEAEKQAPKVQPNRAKLNYADEIILRDTVHRETPMFVTYTDFDSICAYLYSRKLLHTSDFTILTNMLSDKERRNRLYMEILPSKGRHTYRQLYECLRNETEHAGHRDLVEILDKALKDRNSPHSSADSSPTTENSQSDKMHTHSKAKLCCTVICCTVQ